MDKIFIVRVVAALIVYLTTTIIYGSRRADLSRGIVIKVVVLNLMGIALFLIFSIR